MLPAVFSSTVEKQQSFLSDLKSLLTKYNAEITIEDFGYNWSEDNKIVVTLAEYLSDKPTLQ